MTKNIKVEMTKEQLDTIHRALNVYKSYQEDLQGLYPEGPEPVVRDLIKHTAVNSPVPEGCYYSWV